MEKKIETQLEVLCKGFPDHFINYLNYCRSLKFEDKPDYGYLKRVFEQALVHKNIENDFIYDWTGLFKKGKRK